jgi:phage repressor protein C with HTH and peptisase S24 domain
MIDLQQVSSDVARRVAEAIEEAHRNKVSYREMARQAGVSQAVIHRWKNLLGAPKTMNVVKLAEVLGRSPAYLLGFTAGDMVAAVQDGLQSAIREASTISTSAFREVLEEQQREIAGGLTEMRKDFDSAPGTAVAIRRLDLRVSAGGGSIVEDVVTERAPIHFSLDWLHRLKRDPANLVMMSVTGDSMEPTICPHDLIMIDRSRCAPGAKSGIFVYRYGDDLLVKRLHLKAGQILVSGDSSRQNYSPINRTDPQLDIYGRVVWVGREL